MSYSGDKGAMTPDNHVARRERPLLNPFEKS